MTSDASEKNSLVGFTPASLRQSSYIGPLVVLGTWIYLYFRVIPTFYDGLCQLFNHAGYTVIKTTVNLIISSTVSAPGSNTVDFGSGKFYALCGLGGILSCGITHTAIVPLDLVKCRIQVCLI